MRANDGFTLIEALVALAILGLVGASASYALAGADRRAGEALARFRAALLVETLLERSALDLSSAPSDRQGREADGTRWTLSVTPYTEPVGDQVYIPIGLVRVTATAVAAGAGRGAEIRLETLRSSDQWTPR